MKTEKKREDVCLKNVEKNFYLCVEGIFEWNVLLKGVKS